jgi:hypothetical protein
MHDEPTPRRGRCTTPEPPRRATCAETAKSLLDTLVLAGTIFRSRDALLQKVSVGLASRVTFHSQRLKESVHRRASTARSVRLHIPSQIVTPANGYPHIISIPAALSRCKCCANFNAWEVRPVTDRDLQPWTAPRLRHCVPFRPALNFVG